MWSAPAVQWSIDVLRYLSCGLECADLLQESAYDIEATLITVRVLAVGSDSNPIEDQRGRHRPRTSAIAPVGNKIPKELFSVFQAPSILGVAMRIDLGHGAFQCQELFCVGRQGWEVHRAPPGHGSATRISDFRSSLA
jgi:hypothetical protein